MIWRAVEKAAATLLAVMAGVIHEFAMVRTTALHVERRARQDLLMTNETSLQHKNLEEPNPLQAN